MWNLLFDRYGAFARALVDRLAFIVESLAVALLLIGFLGIAALRFDFNGAAYVWGFFWMRVAQTPDPVRAPVLALLGLVILVTTAMVAWVRWSRARRLFEAFPPGRRAHLKMLERLG